jgi:hypothetical protein
MSDNNLMQAALKYASYGWPVFPLVAGAKNPLTPNGVYDATTDEGQINPWWTHYWQANIGTPVGPTYHKVSIDVESTKGHGIDGFVYWNELQETNEDIPSSFWWNTWSGGFNALLLIPETVTDAQTVDLGKGVSIRASEGQYVVLPPSEYKDGVYTIINDASLGMAPQWIINEITGVGGVEVRKKPRGAVRKLPERVTPGERHDALVSLVGTMRSRGLPEATAQHAALSFNAEQCDPPKDENTVVETVADLYGRYEPGEKKADHPYSVEDGCLTFTKVNEKDGTTEYIPIKLSNFNAWIEQALTHDDGAEQQKYYKIAGELDNSRKLFTITVAVDAFSRMEWVSQWDGRAVVRVGSYVKDHARAAIQFLSNERGYDVHNVYSHAGWRNINGQWMYLHAGGAIDENGLNRDIDIKFNDSRQTVFDLPKPPEGSTLREVVVQTLALLDTVFGSKMEPLIYTEYAKVFRAPLNEAYPITTFPFLTGRTGTRKTALQSVGQAFFGANFNPSTLPGNWTSTENSLEKLLFTFKDAVCTIDDFKPQGSSLQVQRYHSVAERVIRGHANKAGRGRMRPDGSFAPTYYSRAFACGSGEDIPKGESLRGRMLIMPMHPGDIDLEILTRAQKMASDGVFASVMSAFVKWLAPQIADLKISDEIKTLFEKKRSEYMELLRERGVHERVSGALADLYIGFEFLMRFASSIGVTKEKITEYRAKFDTILLDLGKAQAQYTRSEEPTTQFIDLVGALLVSGRAHICDISTNQEPYDYPMALGWVEDTRTDHGVTWKTARHLHRMDRRSDSLP